MKIVHFLLTVFAAWLFLAAPQNARAGQAVSQWVSEGAAKLRLVAGAPGSDGTLRAGLEIRLEPGWKTYWINPGPTGIPPRIDFSGSVNLASAEPLWPAPVRFDDGGTQSAGYSGHLVVPLRITPKEAGKPVLLKAALDYGMCENICVPARTELAIELNAGAPPDAMAGIQISGFEARVPVAAKLGGEAPLAIAALARTDKGLGVSVRFPEGAAVTDLFASAPDAAIGLPERTGAGSYRIKLKSGALPKIIDLVAVADGRAIKVPVALDDLPLKP